MLCPAELLTNHKLRVASLAVGIDQAANLLRFRFIRYGQ